MMTVMTTWGAYVLTTGSLLAFKAVFGGIWGTWRWCRYLALVRLYWFGVTDPGGDTGGDKLSSLHCRRVVGGVGAVRLRANYNDKAPHNGPTTDQGSLQAAKAMHPRSPQAAPPPNRR
eukprot:7229093-Prymnesium_polylepis.1